MGDLAVELGFYPADWVGGDMSKGIHTHIAQTYCWLSFCFFFLFFYYIFGDLLFVFWLTWIK